MAEAITLTEAEYHQLDTNMQGLCTTCHEEHDGCEPDARKYPCDNCETKTVYGISELLIMGLIRFTNH